MTREDAISCLKWHKEDLTAYDFNVREAIDMAIEALSKPNYVTDTEVRLAVTDRNKDKVVLWDAFGEVEYYPNGEINCVHCPHYHETEDDTGVHSHCGSHGRLIDADALEKELSKRWDISDDQDFCNKEVWDALRNAPTVPVVDITKRDLCEDISCTDCPFMKETCKLMDYVAYADRPHGEWVTVNDMLDVYICDQCGEIYQIQNIPMWHFCPNCGADMRKENK